MLSLTDIEVSSCGGYLYFRLNDMDADARLIDGAVNDVALCDPGVFNLARGVAREAEQKLQEWFDYERSQA